MDLSEEKILIWLDCINTIQKKLLFRFFQTPYRGICGGGHIVMPLEIYDKNFDTYFFGLITIILISSNNSLSNIHSLSIALIFNTALKLSHYYLDHIPLVHPELIDLTFYIPL